MISCASGLVSVMFRTAQIAHSRRYVSPAHAAAAAAAPSARAQAAPGQQQPHVPLRLLQEKNAAREAMRTFLPLTLLQHQWKRTCRHSAARCPPNRTTAVASSLRVRLRRPTPGSRSAPRRLLSGAAGRQTPKASMRTATCEAGHAPDTPQ